MCLTIPKKVVEIKGEEIVVEDMSGIRQTVRTLVELEIGNWVLLQQGIVLEVIADEQVQEIREIIGGGIC